MQTKPAPIQAAPTTQPFLANKQAAIRRALAAADLAQARRLVNGGSNGLDRLPSAFHIGAGLLERSADNTSSNGETPR